MQHWTVAAAEVWEDLLDLPYGNFFDHYQNSKARKVKDLAAILVANDYNTNPSIDVQAHLATIKALPLAELYTRIAAIYAAQAEKKSEAPPSI